MRYLQFNTTRLFFFVTLLLLLVHCQSAVTPEENAPSPSLTPAILETAPTVPANSTLRPPAIVVEVVETPTPTTSTTIQSTLVPSPTTETPSIREPIQWPSDVNPLTGQTVADPAILARRPLAIKISNAPPIVRPQSGLNKADLVFEHYAEGGLTRFTAVFYSQDAETVGSIRSGRLIDLEIPQMYDAAFAYSGSSGPVRLMFRDSDFFERIISPDFAHGGFFRVEDPNKAFEHTLFTSTYNLRFILDERAQNVPPKLNNYMAFSEPPPATGTTASQLEIRYDGTNATWTYQAGNGRYTRWTDGTPHLDANTGEQLNFRNIVVLAAHHENTDILEDFVGGGNYSIQIQIWGEGPVSIFRDGQRFDGRWQRQDPSHMLTFYDLDGNPMPLAPGNTFFQMVPLGFDQLIVTP